MSRLRPILAAGVALAALAGPAAADPLKVVATFSILGDMVSVVGGDRVAVTTLVGPDGDAHVYQPTPADARAVAETAVMVVNGLGFEGFLDRLTEAAGFKGPVIVAAAAVKPIEGAEEGHDDHAAEAGEAHDHDHDHDAKPEEHAGDAHDHDHDAKADDHAGHDHGGLDPHAWQNPANAVLYVGAIADGLCAADAAGCDGYRANAAAYTAELTALDQSIRRRVAAIPPEKRVVVTSHDAFGYFAEAYGVRFVSPQGISTESEAAASDLAGVIGEIRATGVKTIFIETISDPRLMERIAAETGATIGDPLYSDALSAADGPAASYLAMMTWNADRLIAAMSEAK